MHHESAQLSGLEAVVVASPVFCLLASVEDTTFPLKYPCDPSPPRGGRPSLGDRLPPWGEGETVERCRGGDFKGGVVHS